MGETIEQDEERDDMSESWQAWVGRTVDGRFPLLSYLGGSDHSAVFLTLAQGGVGDAKQAAIKLIPAGAADAEKQLLRWEKASELTHPNLIRIFAAGRCNFDGTALLYVVEEYAEENLAQILPGRALTADEARALLPPLVEALQYAHEKGLVHGHIQPSNILAVADQVKLSSDALGAVGEQRRGAPATSAYDPPEYDPPEAATDAVSTAVDNWQLGMTLVEALTQRLPVWDRARRSAPEVPATVPEPFREIAKHCLQVDPAKRWTIAEISHRLGVERQGPTSAQTEKAVSAPAIRGHQNLAQQNIGQQNLSQRKASAKWPYALGLAVVLAVAFFLMARPKRQGPPAEVQSTHTEHGAPAENLQSAPAPALPGPKPRPHAPGAAKVGATKVEGEKLDVGSKEKASTNTGIANTDHQSGVGQRVMPKVSPSALRTIQGKVKVRVKVEVDAAGNVAKAGLESAGPSKYFSRAALDAAKGWKFSPLQSDESGTREWTLHFAFSRAKTEVSAVRSR